jgi:hypothetical protein
MEASEKYRRSEAAHSSWMSAATAPPRRTTDASFGKMPTTRHRRLSSFVEPLEGVGRPQLTPVRPREGTEGEHLVLGSLHEGGRLGEATGEGLGHVVPLGGDLLGAGVSEDRPWRRSSSVSARCSRGE